MNESELEAIRRRAAAASAGPWFVRYLDDEYAANLVAIATRPGPTDGEDGSFRDGDVDARDIVAATLIQNPERYVDIADHRWDENAEFIAHAREDVPRLLDEIERLRARN